MRHGRMMASDFRDLEPENPAIGAVQVTKFIHTWLLGFRKADPAYSEALQIARSDAHAEVAARELKEWFVNRLIIDPGVPGPFAPLAAAILATALDRVRWLTIVRAAREEEARS
jgi:hypothetical protein